MTLGEKLENLYKSNNYPFHMPGHKRMALNETNPYAIDITEIEGFDNLNDPKDVILDLEKRIANLYRADRAYLLVNGSTQGNLSAIFAGAKKSGKILMSRTSHKSVYHAAEIRSLTTVYLHQTVTKYDFPGLINPMDVNDALKKDKTIDAVVITSPSYEGVIQDIASIAEIAHAYGKPLIVDAAHGAHLGIMGNKYPNPITLGADVVVTSWHKTLPAFTQTAVLLVSKESLIKKETIEKYLQIFGTSSPSYILMYGAEKCLNLIEANGKELFSEYSENLNDFYQKAKGLEKIKIVTGPEIDLSKIIISVKNTSTNGKMLMDLLREEYHIELEMASGSYALAMTSIMDSKEGFDRLYTALSQIDQMLEATDTLSFIYDQIPEVEFKMSSAVALPQEKISKNAAAGRIAADTISIYPPGIPFVVPGELISDEILEYINLSEDLGMSINGISEDGMISVVKA